MKIVITALGSRGDIQPLVALGAALRDAGHVVCIATDPVFRPMIEARDLLFAPMGHDIRALLAGEQGALFEHGRNPLVLALAIRRMSGRLGRMWGDEVVQALEGADALIAGGAGIWVGVAAVERLGIPVIGAGLQPLIPTRCFPSPFLPPPSRSWPGWANMLSHRVIEWIMWQAFRPLTNVARVQAWGLQPWGLASPARHVQAAGVHSLQGYSPVVVPPPADWPAEIHVTGYWFLDHLPDWQPPQSLVDFLEGGAAPVYVGFGSMGERHPRAATRLLLDAIQQSGQRAVVSVGWAGLGETDLPPNVALVDDIPHDWLFSRVAAVVHHGGAGTTAAAVRAGVPSVIIPFLGDQPFWGARLAHLGAAPPALPRARLDAARLGAAIHIAATDTEMRGRAADLGARVRAEDGTGRAVQIIAGILEDRPSASCGNGLSPATAHRAHRVPLHPHADAA